MINAYVGFKRPLVVFAVLISACASAQTPQQPAPPTQQHPSGAGIAAVRAQLEAQADRPARDPGK